MEQKERLSPTHSLRVWALRELGLPKKADADKLQLLDGRYLAAQAGISGLSHDDARAAWKASKRAVMEGKAKAETLVDFETVRMRYSARRAVVRAEMLKHTREAAAIVADLYEQAAPQIPALAKSIDARERALVLGSGPAEKSRLVRTIECLEEDFKLHAKRLRNKTMPSRPAHLLATE